MKKFISFLMIAGLLLPVFSCQKRERQLPIAVNVQLQFEGSAFAVEGVTVTLTDAAGTATYEAETDASGLAEFLVPAGSYSASSVYKLTQDGERIAYNGTNANILVAAGLEEPFIIALLKVVSQQIIIKELYNSGCMAEDGQSAYQSDQYFVIYNNSGDPADVSNLVFGVLAPYTNASNNAYYGEDNVLAYENADWIPACGALWWFQEASVTLAPYTEMVIVVAAAINHTETNANSVDLSKADYYWMCNADLGQRYDMAKKYQVSENIPVTHYLTGKAFAMSPNGWPLDAGSPAFFVGKMPRAEAEPLCLNSDAYDVTAGAMFKCIHFPKANMVDAVEVWGKGSEETGRVRFPADVNSNYVLLTPKLGYSVYRNVDKEATEALPENAGKLVYGYTGGTEEVEGTTDPSGIDAEASMANGAHIIYSETNNSFLDFHQRKVASLKK